MRRSLMDLQKDPPDINKDTERSPSNILGALMNFPTNHTFTVIGRTNGDVDEQNGFVDGVREATSSAGTHSFDLNVSQRGINFTKATITLEVSSPEMISEMNARLNAVESSVMQF